MTTAEINNLNWVNLPNKLKVFFKDILTSLTSLGSRITVLETSESTTEYIPLNGTITDSPISGDLRFIAGKGLTCTNANEDALNKALITDSSFDVILYLDSETIIIYSLGQAGISSNTDFVPQVSQDFIQKGYLETQIPIAPPSGTYILKSINGVHQWIEEV